MSATPAVKPNKRGARSRELVLDTAQRLMAEQGYEAATVSRLVEEAGIPPSSVYHYFGSKEGVLLAVLERGAEQFFAALPAPATKRVGNPEEHLRLLIGSTAEVLAQHPDFLRLLVVMAAQPSTVADGEAQQVISRVRTEALDRLRVQVGVATGLDPGSPEAVRIARFALAAFDGAFIASQADESVEIGELLEQLPAALVGMAGA